MYQGNPKQLAFDLEEMMDKYSITTLIETLSSIAGEKAEHVRTNWQDERLGKTWDRMARVLDRSMQHVNKVEKLIF